MDKNREKGAERELKGKLNEVVGDATDDHSQEMKGKLQKNVGEMQREWGEEQDESRRTRH